MENECEKTIEIKNGKVICQCVMNDNMVQSLPWTTHI